MKTKLIVIKIIACLCYGFAVLALVNGLTGIQVVTASTLWAVFYQAIPIAATGLIFDVLSDLGLNVLDIKTQQEEMQAESVAPDTP